MYTYSRREELAKAKGFPSYSEYRKATPARREAATAKLAKANKGTYRGHTGPALKPATRPRRRQVTTTPGHTTVDTTRPDVVMSQLRKAARRGWHVSARVTFRTVPIGQSRLEVIGNYELPLWQHGGWSAAAILDRIDNPTAEDRHAPGDVFGALESMANAIPGVSGASGVVRVHLELFGPGPGLGGGNGPGGGGGPTPSAPRASGSGPTSRPRDATGGSEPAGRPRKATTKRATVKRAPGKRAPGKRVTTKRAGAKRATTKRATTKRAGTPSVLDVMADAIDTAADAITETLEEL